MVARPRCPHTRLDDSGRIHVSWFMTHSDPGVLMFGINYAPEPSGNAPYTTSLAEYLVASGWRVSVITGMPHYPAWRKTPAPQDFPANGVKVVRRDHYVPANPNAIGRGMMELTWAASGFLTGLSRHDADVVVGVVPTLSGAALALTAARRLRVPCVLWIQDLMGQAARQSGAEGGSKVAAVVERAELSLARRADAVIAVSEGFRKYLTGGGVDPTRVRLARNWSLLPSTARGPAEARRGFGLAPHASVIVHSGNMGAKQGLDVVLAAASAMKAATFVLQGGGSERDRLASGASNMQNVVFLPSLSAEDLADLLGCADALLLTQRPSVTDMSLPSKLMSYLASRRPIVASVSPESEAARFLEEIGVGVRVAPGDAEALVGGIRSVLKEIESGSDRQQADFDASSFASPRRIEEILRDVISA